MQGGQSRSRALVAAAVLVAAFMLFAGLGRLPLMQPDEGRNAEVAREMKASGSWLIPTYNGMVYLDKPAFYFRTVALSMSAFGESEFAARLPNAIFAGALLVLAFFFCRRACNERCAALAVLIVATTPLFFVFARIVIMDMTLAFFVCAALFAGYFAEENEGATRRNWYLAGSAASAFATLVKGPVGFLIPCLVLMIFDRIDGRRGAWKRMFAPLNLLLFFAIVLPWFFGVARRCPDFPRYGIIEESFHRFTTASFHRTQPFYFYGLIIAGGFFAWSILLPESIFAAWQSRKRWSRADRFCMVWSIVTVIFFSLSKSKLAGYILTITVSMGILTARVFDSALAGKTGRAARLVLRSTTALAVLASVVAAVLGFGLRNPSTIDRLFRIRQEGFQHLGTYLLPVWGVLLYIACMAWYARWRRDLIIAIVAFTCLPVMLMIGGFAGLKAYAEFRSARDLANQIQPLSPDTELATIGYYPDGLSFYLKRTATLITRDGTELKSNYVLFSLKKTRTWPDNLVPIAQRNAWLATRTHPVYLLARKQDLPWIEEAAAVRGGIIWQLTPSFWGVLIQPPKGT